MNEKTHGAVHCYVTQRTHSISVVAELIFASGACYVREDD